MNLGRIKFAIQQFEDVEQDYALKIETAKRAGNETRTLFTERERLRKATLDKITAEVAKQNELCVARFAGVVQA